MSSKSGKMCELSIAEVHNAVLRNCYSLDKACSSFYQNEINTIQDMLLRLASLKESNSLLLIGSRGSGKSTCCNYAISSFADQHKDLYQSIVFVRLNGFLQTNDRLVLSEINRQLSDNVTLDGEPLHKESCLENFNALLVRLQRGNGSKITTPFVFILDEFDLFALHHSQSLLYNLFDSTQRNNPPILVLGMSCRMDVLELLEKRVKSRFSHRQLLLLNSWSFDEYFQCIRLLLTIFDRRQLQSNLGKKWNLSDLLEDEAVKLLANKCYKICRGKLKLMALVTLSISSLSCEVPFLTLAELENAFGIVFLSNSDQMLQGLTVLELCLLIAAMRLVKKYDEESFNFEAIYTEFKDFATAKCRTVLASKPVCMKTYQHLLDLELLSLASIGQTHKDLKMQQMELNSVRLEVTTDQIHDAVEKCETCPVPIKMWVKMS